MAWRVGMVQALFAPLPLPVSLRSRFSRVGAPRAGLLAALGSALVGPGVLPAVAPLMAGCTTEPPPDTVPLTGVRTTVVEQPEGGFLIDSEELTEGAGELVVVRRDSVGGEMRETVRDPAQFASLLPAPGGASASWDEPAGEAAADTSAVVRRRGFPLGQVLFATMLYQAWRPAGYGPGAAAPARAYTGRQSVLARQRTASGLASARQRGTLATPSRVQQARSVRATAPTGGRSGAFSRGLGGRSGGG